MTVSSVKTRTPLLRYALIGAAMVWMIGFAAAPKAAADTFTLNQIFCNCLPAGSSAGTVTLTQVGADVTTLIELASGLTFHQSNGLDAFGFNVDVPRVLTPADFTYAPGWTPLFGPLHEDGAGTFQYGFACIAATNGCLGSPTTFTFTTHNVTLADMETTVGGTSNTDLAANVANIGAAGCTGMVGAGNGTADSTPWGGYTGDSPCGNSPSVPSVPTVPEPASLVLLGSGLAAIAHRLRRRSPNRT